MSTPTVTMFESPKTHIVYNSEANFIEQMIDILQAGRVNGVYVHMGRLVMVARVQGVPGQAVGDEGRSIAPLTAPLLRKTLAQEFTVQEQFASDKGEPRLIDHIPSGSTLDAVLSNSDWSGVPQLLGVTGVPVIQPGGSVQLERGYSPDTRRYYHPLRGVPSLMTLDAARSFLLDEVLRDLPYVSDTDKANLLGHMLTPLVREYLDADGSSMVAPGLLVSAAVPGTGKSLVADLVGVPYGQTVQPWSSSVEEQRKVAVTCLMTPNPVVVFDNLTRGSVISSSPFEALLTSTTYTDRILGKSQFVSLENRKVFVWTGNNVSAASEMAARMVPVNLDAGMARPDRRPMAQFTIPDLPRWLKLPANQTRLLSALVTVVAEWVRAGAPESEYAWRSFSAWASNIAGLLQWLGVDGFLVNRDEFEASSDETADLDSFLSAWHRIYGSRSMSTTELLDKTGHDYMTGGTPADKEFRAASLLRRADGKPVSKKAAGDILREQAGRVTSDNLRLVPAMDAKSNRRNWAVEKIPAA